MRVPEQHHWVFWDVYAGGLDTERQRNYIIPRMLERGTLEGIRWLLEVYGREGIHAFLRDVGHPEISRRTLSFWRAVLKAVDEQWASTAPFRASSGVPWLA